MKSTTKFALALVFFVTLSFSVFRSSVGMDEIFSASDANIGQLAGGRPTLSMMFSPSYGGYILGDVRAPRFSPYALLQALLPAEVFNDLVAPLLLVLSSICLLSYLRIMGRSWYASVFGSIVGFWLGSSTLSVAGHYGKLGAALFFVLGLVLIEKTVRSHGLRRWYWAVLCGTSVGFMLLSQQDIGMLFGVALGPYAVFRLIQLSSRKPMDWVALLVPTALLGIMLSAGTALSSYEKNVTQASTVQTDKDDKWDFITQWSFPPKEFPELLAPAFMGWKTGDPQGPYWGINGQSKEWTITGQGFRNFRLDSVYFGVVPFVLGLLAIIYAIRRREDKGDSDFGTVLFWGAMAFLTFLLACGKFTPLYHLFVKLPFYGDIRVPTKFLHNFVIMVGILSAFGVDALFGYKAVRKPGIIITAAFGACFLLISLALVLWKPFWINAFVDWGELAPVIVNRMIASSLYAAVSAGILILLLIGVSRTNQTKFIGYALCLLPIVDSLYITSHFITTENVATLRKGNVVINYLVENQGDHRVFTFQRDGIYNRWIAVDFPYHGVNGFWFWQAPRLSQDYKDYLTAGSRNLVSLLQSASVKYALAPVGAINQLPKEIFKPVMIYKFGMDSDKNLVVKSLPRPSSAQDQVVLELQQTLPRMALFHKWRKVAPEKMKEELFSTTNNVVEQVLVEAELPASTGSGFDVVDVVKKKNNKIIARTNSRSSGVLLFTQRYQPQWKAYVDGQNTAIFRCNDLAMGIHIPAGAHEVVFKIKGSRTGVVLQLTGLGLSITALLFLILTDRRPLSG